MSAKTNHTICYLTAEWILPVVGDPIQQGFVAIQDNHIVDVGACKELPKDVKASPPKPGTLISPGFINTHTHLEQSFEATIPKAAEENFVSWLLRVIEATSASNTPEQKLARCRQGSMESLQYGTTCLNDIASGPESAQAILESGLRATVSLEVFHPGFETIQIDHWIGAYQSLLEATASNPLVSTGLSPHSPYNVSPKAWQALLKAIKPTLVHTHLGEFEDETAYMAGHPSQIINLHQRVLGKTFRPEIPARSPLQALMRKGLLETPTVIAHAIHLNESDRQELKTLPVGIAHCPRSNLALHGKTLHWGDWKSSPTPVGLGTDGRLSTPDLDLRAEARAAIAQHGWDARQALEALTLQGARALGQAHEIGSLQSGKLADLVIWQAGPNQDLPPEALLLAPDTQVKQVIIHGKLCFQQDRPSRHSP